MADGGEGYRGAEDLASAFAYGAVYRQGHMKKNGGLSHNGFLRKYY
jgi:hypothetical protein